MESCSECPFCVSNRNMLLVILVLCITSWQFLIFCSLVREIEWIRGRRFWPQGMSQQSAEGSRNGTSLWKHLLRLNYHSAQSPNTVSSAMCANTEKLQRAKSTDLAPDAISNKSKIASRKGKKVLRPIVSISAEEKTQQKTQNTVEIWNGPEKEALEKSKGYFSKILSAGTVDDVVKLSRQRILSADVESGTGQATNLCQHHLLWPLSTNTPEPITELISEKWLFHRPDYSSVPQKCFLPRSQCERYLWRTSKDTSKELKWSWALPCLYTFSACFI